MKIEICVPIVVGRIEINCNFIYNVKDLNHRVAILEKILPNHQSYNNVCKDKKKLVICVILIM